MDLTPRPLLLSSAASPHLSRNRLRGRALFLFGAAALHLVPLALLLSALPLKPKSMGGAFGQSISVTLVPGAPTRAAAPQEARPNLTNLAQRLSEQGLKAAVPSALPAPSASTRLSDLFDQKIGAPGQAPVSGPTLSAMAGTGDDPFARASVSYRGDDPAKASRLQTRAQRCAQGARALRLLLIINAEGYLVARPRPLSSTANDAKTARTIAAVERCAPFADAATPGPPRSYEINVG